MRPCRSRQRLQNLILPTPTTPSLQLQPQTQTLQTRLTFQSALTTVLASTTILLQLTKISAPQVYPYRVAVARIALPVLHVPVLALVILVLLVQQVQQLLCPLALLLLQPPPRLQSIPIMPTTTLLQYFQISLSPVITNLIDIIISITTIFNILLFNISITSTITGRFQILPRHLQVQLPSILVLDLNRKDLLALVRQLLCRPVHL